MPDQKPPVPAPPMPAQSDEARRRAWDQQDREVAEITETVQPKSDAPSRAGITGSGSGADSER